MRKDEQVKVVCQALKARGEIEDFEYDHFKTKGAVPPPFAIYRRVAKDNTPGDDVVYHHGAGVDLELYAETPEDMAELMAAAEALLDGAELFYQLTADTVYIESEDFYESLYEL